MVKTVLFLFSGILFLASCGHNNDDSPNPSGNLDSVIIKFDTIYNFDTIYITVDSSNISNGSYTIGIGIPDSVKKYIILKYPGYAMYEFKKGRQHGEDNYEIRIRKGDTKIRLYFNLRWVLIGIKYD